MPAHALRGLCPKGARLNREERNRLAVENLPLVGYLVSDVIRRAPHLSREDLAAAGSLALVTAARAFDPGQGVKFSAFARRRIIGAFMDEMRANDWAGREARRKIKTVQAVADTLTAQLGRPPTASEIAGTLGIEPGEARQILADGTRTVAELNEINSASLTASAQTPEETVLSAEQLHYLRAAVESLPEKMRYIVEQVYFHDRSVKELAAEFGSSHSAVSQLRAEAIRLLRDGLNTHYGETEATPEPESRVTTARRHAYLAKMGSHASARAAHSYGTSAMAV